VRRVNRDLTWDLGNSARPPSLTSLHADLHSPWAHGVPVGVPSGWPGSEQLGPGPDRRLVRPSRPDRVAPPRRGRVAGCRAAAGRARRRAAGQREPARDLAQDGPRHRHGQGRVQVGGCAHRAGRCSGQRVRLGGERHRGGEHAQVGGAQRGGQRRGGQLETSWPVNGRHASAPTAHPNVVT